MPLEHVRRNDESLARDVARFVDKVIAKHGVPVTVEQVDKLVELIYPRVQRMRRAAWRAHVVELGRQAAAAGVVVTPEPPRPYPRKALFDAISQVSRLAPDSTHLRVMMLDEASKQMVEQAVKPDFTNRADHAVKTRVATELGRRLSRHVVDAGRSAVADAAHNGSARFRATGDPARAGYARVLSGRESCAFCTMLASRGPVYQEDTVITRKDGRRYHDGCDCIPVLVVDGEPWEGQKQATLLSELWQAQTWEGGKPASDQFKRWTEFIAGGGFSAAKYSPFDGK